MKGSEGFLADAHCAAMLVDFEDELQLAVQIHCHVPLLDFNRIDAMVSAGIDAELAATSHFSDSFGKRLAGYIHRNSEPTFETDFESKFERFKFLYVNVKALRSKKNISLASVMR